MPTKGKKKAILYSDDVLKHPTVAPLYHDLLLKEKELKPVLRLGNSVPRKLEAQKAVEVAKTAFEAVVAQLREERWPEPNSADNGAETTADQTSTDKFKSASDGADEQEQENTQLAGDIVMLSGTSGPSNEDEEDMFPEEDRMSDTKLSNNDNHDDEVAMELDDKSDLSSAPDSSPAAMNETLPNTEIDETALNSIRNLQRVLDGEEKIREGTESDGAVSHSVAPEPSEAIAAGISNQYAAQKSAHLSPDFPPTFEPPLQGSSTQPYPYPADTPPTRPDGSSSGFSPKFENPLQASSRTGFYPYPTPLYTLKGKDGSNFTSNYVNPAELNFMQLQALAGRFQDPPTNLFASPAADLSATQSVNHQAQAQEPAFHKEPAVPSPAHISINKTASDVPPANPASLGQADTPTPDNNTARYDPPVWRADMFTHIPMQKLQDLKNARRETYKTPGDLARATELYQKHAIPMYPDDVYVREELLLGLPETTTSMYDWARVCNYEQLCRTDQIILQARGRAAIDAYVAEITTQRPPPPPTGKKSRTSPKPTIKPTWVRTLVMRFACYLPEAGTTSPEVSLEFLRDKHDQFKCLYHHKQRSKDVRRCDTVITHAMNPKRVGFVEFVGVAHPLRSGTLQELNGHLNCGCSVKDALIELYLFKTMLAYSTNPRFDHLAFNWEPDTIIPTHVRAFLASLLRQYTGLDGDSPALYTGVNGWGPRAGQWASDDFLDTMKKEALKQAMLNCFAGNLDVNTVMNEFGLKLVHQDSIIGVNATNETVLQEAHNYY